jgi:hypothetical protein
MMIPMSALPLAAACLAAAVFAGGAAAGGRTDVCSLASFPTVRVPVQLIATATPDTLPASAGGMEYTLENGTRERPVYGQVVRVERVGGADAAAFPAGADRAVVVPWSYDAGCRRTLWTGSARWTEPGERGLYWASLRPRDQWVDGLPTFDEGDPFQSPYPGRSHEGRRTDSLLTIEQLFGLVELLPTSEDDEADPEAAARPLKEWARANPDLARLHPASDILRFADYSIRYDKLRRMRSPLGGTWRFTVSVDGSAPRTFFARSRTEPTSEWDPTARGVDEDESPPGSPIRGYSLLLAASDSETSLPTSCCESNEGRREGYLSVVVEPDSVRGGVRFWRGDMEMGLLVAAFPADTAMRAIARADSDRYARLSAAREPVEVLARFVLRPDGSATMEQTTRLDDGRRIVIRGERTSRVTVGWAH